MSAPDVADARADLAPRGVLRAGMNLSNTLFTWKDAAGALAGVSVDLMAELGRRLGVPVEHVMHATPGDVADAADAGTWDVAILAIEPARAARIAFSPPMTEIEANYLVRDDSPLRRADEADAAGVRIAAPAKGGYELYLARTLKHATLVSAKGIPASVECFDARDADVLAGLRPMLLETMKARPGTRLLEGRFMTVNHGMGTPVARRAGAAYLDAFVRDVVAGGFVAGSIARHGVQGLSAVR